MRSTLYFRTVLGTPWGLDVPAHPNVARFHVVIDGACLIETPGTGTKAMLQRGDLALVPHGARHILRGSDDAQAVLVDRVLDETAYDGSCDLRYGGDGPKTTLVCGHFAFDDELAHPTIDALPPVVHVSAAEGHDFTWLDAATRTIGGETAQRPPGWEVVVDKVSEILFVQALRLHYTRAESSAPIAAFVDDRLSRALAAIHAAPDRDWGLEALARLAGMSRTAFAVRFRELMGMPPIAYITRWRLQKARAALVDSEDIIANIAVQSGYHSEAAFSRAFQRLYGKPPGTYRREYAAS